MRLPPKKRNESIVTAAMAWNIGITAAFFIVVMLTLLASMKKGFLANGEVPAEGEDFTVRQMTLFFSIYVFFQVWNQINARSLSPEISGFHRILHNPLFLGIAALTAIGQIVIVTFGGAVFKVVALGVYDWLAVVAFTASVLVFAEIVRQIRLAVSPPPAE